MFVFSMISSVCPEGFRKEAYRFPESETEAFSYVLCAGSERKGSRKPFPCICLKRLHCSYLLNKSVHKHNGYSKNTNSWKVPIRKRGLSRKPNQKGNYLKEALTKKTKGSTYGRPIFPFHAPQKSRKLIFFRKSQRIDL